MIGSGEESALHDMPASHLALVLRSAGTLIRAVNGENMSASLSDGHQDVDWTRIGDRISGHHYLREKRPGVDVPPASGVTCRPAIRSS
jgi:hypothetical protein